LTHSMERGDTLRDADLSWQALIDVNIDSKAEMRQAISACLFKRLTNANSPASSSTHVPLLVRHPLVVLGSVIPARVTMFSTFDY
jgi:hypothetical protein